MIQAGQQVKLKPEYQDDGDNEHIWIAINTEEKGRVDIQPITSTLSFKPIYTVYVDWLE